MTQHPFRDAELRVFQRTDGGEFIARFAPYATYPVVWAGATEAVVREAAEAFRADAIAKHEAGFIARSEALAKAREARKSAKKESGL